MLPTKKIIYGCEARGDAESPYLTRYTLLNVRDYKLCLHIFHRSDADDLHDHPWPFLTMILWRGYIEETPTGKRRLWPLTLHYRPAQWRHRVELIRGRCAVTLVLMGKYERSWGFWTPKGWQQWREYFLEKGC